MEIVLCLDPQRPLYRLAPHNSPNDKSENQYFVHVKCCVLANGRTQNLKCAVTLCSQHLATANKWMCVIHICILKICALLCNIVSMIFHFVFIFHSIHGDGGGGGDGGIIGCCRIKIVWLESQCMLRETKQKTKTQEPHLSFVCTHNTNKKINEANERYERYTSKIECNGHTF